MPKPKLNANDFQDPVLTTGKKDLPTVVAPSGRVIPLLSKAEVEFYEDISQRYQENNKFSNVSDLLELDRLLNYEIMCSRWNQFILMGHDYDGEPISSSLQKDLQIYSKEVRDIKTGLGIDKKTRDRDQGTTFAAYMDNLHIRCREFGIHRDEQIIEAITLWKELQGIITLYKNSTPSERTTFKWHEADIFEWLDEKFIEFDKIDEAFQVNQKMWIREIND